jgi:tetratricopeptide (TPR) repeat protein
MTQHPLLGAQRRPVPRLHLLGPALGLLLTALFSGPVPAFYNVAIGATLENAALPTLDGGRRDYLGSGEANVFVFFRPGQAHSEEVLRQLEALKGKLADRPVYWSAIVSDAYSRGSVEELVREVGLDMPVLVDGGDRLYGRLGVILHPVVGIADRQHRLQAYVPFRELNFSVIVEAHIRHVLGEIDAQRLSQILAPKPAVNGGDRAVARRNLKLAKMLYDMKRYDAALKAARKSAGLNADLAEAHALVGAILAHGDDCAGARAPLARALALEPRNATALTAQETCRSSGAH